MLAKFFEFHERNTSFKTEFMAGFSTFLATSYILILNPAILNMAGMPFGKVFTATILASVLAMIFMGLIANLPIALTPAMGLNAFFAYTVCLKMGYSYQMALTAVFCEGLFFFLISFFNGRKFIINLLPLSLRKAVVAGTGLFLAFIGMQTAGIVVWDAATLVSVGNLVSSETAPAMCGLMIMIALYIKQIKGALLWGMILTTLVAIPFGQVKIPDHFSLIALPSEPFFFDFTWENIFTIDFLIVFLTFLFFDVFNTVGVFTTIGTKTGLMNKDGQIENAREGLMADAIGTIAGSVLGTSTVNSHPKSIVGVDKGGRTGLTVLVTAGFFLMALFFLPLFALIPVAATAPALIIIGYTMIKPLHEIDFADTPEGLPAFLAILVTPTTYSISEGITAGILSYILCNVLTHNTKKISPLTWIFAILFLSWILLR